MIDKIHLKNFTVFNDVKLDFSSKINVIVGENGTGKTHLLKAAYGVCSGNNQLTDQLPTATKMQTKKAVGQQLTRCFLPPGKSIGELKRNCNDGKAEIIADFAFGKSLGVTFGRRSKGIQFTKGIDYEDYSWQPIFLPSKEILSFYRGVHHKNTDRETVERLFDGTHLDLFKLLDGPQASFNADQLEHPRVGEIAKNISNPIGGVFELANGRVIFRPGEIVERRKKAQKDLGVLKETVFVPAKTSEVECELMAEGHRKIGMLQRLLMNGALVPGASGTLFWDEPESNLNPALIEAIVTAVFELARNGQQIILATHDYVLLKWLDLLTDAKKEDHVRYHALYRNKSGAVEVESTDDYLAITPNAIADTFRDLYDQDIKRSFGRTK